MTTPLIDNRPVLFGLDLTRLGADLRAAVSGLLRTRALGWLQPQARVVIVDATTAAASVRGAPFVALALPDDIVLQRHIALPALAADEVARAVRLDMLSHSPFAADDTVGAWTSHDMAGGLRVDLASTSRALVHKQVEQQAARLGLTPRSLEVRIPVGAQGTLLLLDGFGEERRLRRERLMAGGVGLLVFGLTVLLAAVIVSPALQSRLRATDAAQAYADLVQKAGPTLSQREDLVRKTLQLQELGTIVAESAQPLVLLDTLTKTLPDEVWLQTLQVQGNKVTLTGQAPNAAALMRLLGTVPGVSDVRAPTAAVKPAGAPKEVFTIEFAVDSSRFAKGS